MRKAAVVEFLVQLVVLDPGPPEQQSLHDKQTNAVSALTTASDVAVVAYDVPAPLVGGLVDYPGKSDAPQAERVRVIRDLMGWRADEDVPITYPKGGGT
jgi:hypothetical protein